MKSERTYGAPRPLSNKAQAVRQRERTKLKAELEATGEAIREQLGVIKRLKDNIKRWSGSARAMERTVAIAQIYYKNLAKKYDTL